jgi:hypothetical protein
MKKKISVLINNKIKKSEKYIYLVMQFLPGKSMEQYVNGKNEKAITRADIWKWSR